MTTPIHFNGESAVQRSIVVLRTAIFLLLMPIASQAAEPSDREHGINQFKRMIADRPAMMEFVDSSQISPSCNVGAKQPVSMDAEIVQWCIDAYGKRILGKRIVWDGAEISSRSNCRPPTATEDGSIRISSIVRDATGESHSQPFEELWISCVFELSNLRNSTRFIELDSQARKGDLSEEQFVRGYIKAEHNATLQTKRFFQEVWSPWAKQSGFIETANSWYMNEPDDFEATYTSKYLIGQKKRYRSFYRTWFAKK